MKKRIFSIVMSAMLVGSISVASVYADTIPESGLGEALSDVTVTEDLDVKNPVYKIVVPTSYDFAVDPFEQMDEGSQIASSDYYVINKSNVNVTTDISFKLAKNSAVSTTLADKKASYDEDTHTKGYLDIAASPSAIDKDKNAASLWIGAAAAYNVTPVNATAKATKLNLNSTTDDASKVYVKDDESTDIKVFKSSITPTGYTAATSADSIGGIAYKNDGTFEYDDITGVSATKYWADTTTGEGKEGALKDLTDASPNVITLGTEATKMRLALAKANSVDVYTDAAATTSVQATGSATADGVTAFRLVGAANPNYKWAASLIDLTVSYNFNGIAASDYGTLKYVGSTDGGKTGESKMVKSSTPTASPTFSLDNNKLTFSNVPTTYTDIKFYTAEANALMSAYDGQIVTELKSDVVGNTSGTITFVDAWKSIVVKAEFITGDGTVVATWTKS